MKFARQLAAVLIVVAAVVALGTAWAHSSQADWIFNPPDRAGGPGLVKLPSGHGPPPGSSGKFIVVAPGKHLPPGVHPGSVRIRTVSGGAPFAPSNYQNLIRTAEIEAAVAAGIVVLDQIRRRYRRAKRARRLAAKT